MRLFQLWIACAAWVAAGDEAWIRDKAVPLKTVEAGNGFADMQPLKKIVGDARIVSLGEATHGSREFFQLKHRMLEFLATEMGFTIFSIEANMPEAYRLNEYVLTGKGDPRTLLKGMYFWTWDTEEVLAMIEWMRKFNAAGKGRVEFTGFDMQTPDVAGAIVVDFVKKHDAELAARFGRALGAVKKAQLAGGTFGVATASIDAIPLRGKKLKYRGILKSENVEGGDVNLWWRADGSGEGQGRLLAFRNLSMARMSLSGTTDWTEREIEVEVPATAERIYFGGTFSGTGTAWFDDLSMTADGEPVAMPGADPGFEGDAPRGFFTGTMPYKVSIDREVAHGGSRSLKMFRAPVESGDAAPDARKTLAEWNGLMSQLEAYAGKSRAEGSAAREIEWALQNARVVRQCLEMKTGQVGRDTSMARNVEWILKQSPAAKIVLWAHNGHVMTSGGSPMGAELRKTYGDGMVVFGFAFHQGSFQAVEQGKSLRNFTVPPARAGSLDAMLAAAGPPIYAVDLRQAPEGLRKPLATRSIGAVYSESAADNFYAARNVVRDFDALLFVEKTTAARRNVPPAVLRKQGDGTWADPEAKVAFRLPEGWTIGDNFRWGDRETTAHFKVPGWEKASPSLYYAMHANKDDAETAARLKTRQRAAAGVESYKLREGSVKTHEIGGRPAMTWVAEYRENGVEMVEEFTRVLGTQVYAQFFTRMPAQDEAKVREGIRPLVESLRLP